MHRHRHDISDRAYQRMKALQYQEERYRRNALPRKGIAFMGYLRNLLFGNHIDVALRRFYGTSTPVSSATRMLPMYRFPDVYRAAAALEAEYDLQKRIESRHDEPLEAILSGSGGLHRRVLNLASSNPRQVGYEQTEYFADECYWVFRSRDENDPFILRTRNLYQMTFVEAAGKDAESVQAFLDRVCETADRHSIYKNKVFEIRFEPSGQDYGTDHEQAFQIHFLPRHEIPSEEIILEDEVRSLIDRNVIDFHRRREQLVKLGVPRKRGLLLYGPPGNGKTYTCKFLAGALPDATTIFAAGTALVQIRTIFNVARLFQPSLIVLEDIDLVYSDRQINPYSPQLGSLMDELDGAADEDNLIVMLTTNSIERVESAIKDRPGRVSQCVEVPNPGPKLRRMYLRTLLARFEDTDLDYEYLVNLTDGASHAFIKEFVYRSVQIASERVDEAGKFTLRTDDFRVAQQEMTQQGGKAGRSIIGFRPND